MYAYTIWLCPNFKYTKSPLLIDYIHLFYCLCWFFEKKITIKVIRVNITRYWCFYGIWSEENNSAKHKSFTLVFILIYWSLLEWHFQIEIDVRKIIRDIIKVTGKKNKTCFQCESFRLVSRGNLPIYIFEIYHWRCFLYI